jgi:hypothetical protein
MIAWAVEFVDLHDLPQAALAALAIMLAALTVGARVATRSMFAAIVREQLIAPAEFRSSWAPSSL